jgi:small nuclear ribonucleoprotein (snRNP)-like protein
VIEALAVAVLVLAAVLVWREVRPAPLCRLEKKRAIVTLKSGEAFEGLLFSVDAESIVLREASALAYGQGSTNVAVQGEAVILRPDIAYLQIP